MNPIKNCRTGLVAAHHPSTQRCHRCAMPTWGASYARGGPDPLFIEEYRNK